MGKLAFIVKQDGENLTAGDMAALDAADIELDGWLGSEDVVDSRSFSYALRYFLLFLEINGTDFEKDRDPPIESKPKLMRQMYESLRKLDDAIRIAASFGCISDDVVDIARRLQADYDQVESDIHRLSKLFEVCVERNLDILIE
jgi:hypothetical protein